MINKLLAHIDYKTLFNSLGDGIVYIQQDGTIAFLNTEARKIFRPIDGFAVGSSIYEQSWTLRTKKNEPVDPSGFPGISVLETQASVPSTIIRIEAAGALIWADISGHTVPCEDPDQPCGAILTVTDLTETMQEKQRLRMNEEKYRSLLNSNTAATFLATPDGRYLDASQGAEAIFGYSIDELKKIGRDAILVQDERFRTALNTRDETGGVVAEVTGRRKSGELFPVLWHSSLFTTSAGEELVSALMVDLTEKNKREQKARKTAFNLQLILDNTDDSFAITDSELRLVTCNESYRKTAKALYGRDVREQEYLPDLADENERASAMYTMQAVLNGDKQIFLRKTTEQGSEVHYHTVIRPLWFEGEVIGTFIWRKDITEFIREQQRSEELRFNLELLMENADDGFTILDSNLAVQRYNRGSERSFSLIHGKSVHAGDNSLDLVPPERRAYFSRLLNDVLQGAKHEIIQYAKDEEDNTIVFQSAYTPLNRNGDVIGVFVLTKDITTTYLAQKETEDAKARLERAIRASFDIISETDLATGATIRNEAFGTIMGYDPAEFDKPSKVIGEIVHPDDRERLNTLMQELLTSGITSFRLPVIRMVKRDGTVVYIDSKGLITRDEKGSPTLMTFVASDVTETVHLQETLVKANSDLERQTQDLKQSNAELEQFAYIASHDLQEPLRMTSSFLKLIEKRYNDKLDDTGRQYMHFAVDGAARMKKLIQDLLQFSRIGSLKGKKDMVDTALLVSALLNEFVFTINEKQASMEVQPLPAVRANKGQLTHVFQNLISNALKYSGPGARIVIGAREEESEWVFFIQDDGIGIDPRYFEKIFIIFQQLHTKNEFSGTGIGLAIARKVVEQHGGRIWVDSGPGQGSIFSFTIPKNTP